MDPNPPRSPSSPYADSDSARGSRCCCFCFPRSWERIALSDDDRARIRHEPAPRKWWRAGARALLKVREWSEIVAGPKWKTFIRRFNRSSRLAGGGSGSGSGRRFGYDPMSYALNFDGGNEGSDDEGLGYPGFSARFTAPPAPAHSTDFGGLVKPPPRVAASVH